MRVVNEDNVGGPEKVCVLFVLLDISCVLYQICFLHTFF